MFDATNYLLIDGKYVEKEAIPPLEDEKLQQDMRVQFEDGHWVLYAWNGYLSSSTDEKDERGLRFFDIEAYGWEPLWEGTFEDVLERMKIFVEATEQEYAEKKAVK